MFMGKIPKISSKRSREWSQNNSDQNDSWLNESLTARTMNQNVIKTKQEGQLNRKVDVKF